MLDNLLDSVPMAYSRTQRNNNPIVAPMLDVAGSLLVVFKSFRLVRQGEDLELHQSAVVSLAPEEPRAVHHQVKQAQT